VSSAADVLGALSGVLPGASSSASSISSAADTLSNFENEFSKATTGQLGIASQGTSSALSSIALLASPPRLAAFIIGIILIGVGVLMFRGTQTVVKLAGRAAA
jgi:hypothetical protein